VARLLVQALGGRVVVPLALVRQRLDALAEKVALEVEGADPGLWVRGEAQALGAPIRFSARVDSDGIRVKGNARTVSIALSEVTLATDADAPGPLADAIRNGMIDTKNPATLIGNMMPLPDMILRAEGREIVIDLTKAPAIEADPMIAAGFAAMTSYLCVTSIEIADDAIVLRLGLLPGGAKEAALSTARAALLPAVRYLWPEGKP
jgi:hypothetical protein